MAGKGTFAAQISAANMTVPIEGASVTVTEADTQIPQLISFLETDINGKTVPVSLDTPDISLSETPGNPKPFAVINVQVDMPLYYSVLIRNVQVFAGIESLQQVEMIPVAEHAGFEEQYRVITYDVAPQDL